MSIFILLGRFVLEFIEEVGAVFILLWRFLQILPRTFSNIKNILVQMERIGIGSIPLVLVTSLFVGAVTSVQAAYQFHGYVPLMYLGTVVGKSVILELGPVLTALVVGGRVSASIAAELGTMKVTEQIDALETMAINPYRFLSLPRIVGTFVALPILTVIAEFVAIACGAAYAHFFLNVPFDVFNYGITHYFAARDFFGGLVKSVFFALVIAASGCYFGFTVKGGAKEVGRAATLAVVTASILILLLDFLIALVIFG